MFGIGWKRLIWTFVLAVILHFIAGVIACCQGNYSFGVDPNVAEACIRTGRPIDLCLSSDYRILLIEVYLINIFFWWLVVNVLVILFQKLELSKKLSRKKT